jgi:hypothetical protein
MTSLSRRRILPFLPGLVLGALPALSGCSTPLPLAAPLPSRADPGAVRWLRESAEAHGEAAYRALADINVAFEGEWRPLIGRVQPEIVDAAYRHRSEERLLPAARAVAHAHRGPGGHKQVWRRAGRAPGDLGEVDVWYDGTRADAAGVRSAAALVADCGALFLLGPLWLAERTLAVDAPGAPVGLGGRVVVEGRECQWIDAWLRPGLGLSSLDRVSIAIDRDDRTTRRLRFTLEGYPGTRGAVAEVDTYEHQRRHGVLWPMRSFERVVHPLGGLPAHDWRLVGLDVNRGYGADAIVGPEFRGAAAAPAQRA